MCQKIKSLFKRLNRLLRENDLKNITILSGGVVISQMISIIAQPIAARLYTPRDFGIMAIITSLVGIFASSLDGQYHLSIVSAKSDKEANAITALSIYFGLIVSAIVSLGIVIYTIASPKTFVEAGLWIYLAIPLIFMSGISNVIASYNNRYEQYKLLASVALYRAVASNIVKLGLGFAQIGFTGLITANVVSVLAGIKKQSAYLRKNLKLILSTNKKELFEVLKKYKVQPLFSAPGIFVVSYSYSIVPIFISIFYGIQEVGYYSLTIVMLGLPVSLVSGNVGTVFFRKASIEKAKYGCFYRSLKSSFILLFLLSIVPFVVLFFFAEPLFSFLFGTEWLRSGTFVQLLIPWYWMNFIVGSLMYSFIISGNQLTKLIIQCLFVVFTFAVFYAAKSKHLPIEEFLLTISIVYAFTYLILLFVIFKASKQKTNSMVDSSLISYAHEE